MAPEDVPEEGIARRTVAIVAHTHWDREWYRAFQTMRLLLVEMFDEVLRLLEADPSYAHFLLDGQLAAVDDYLALRPEAGDRLRRLVGSGRISIGPWYVLPDEFCVSGETLVRNLEAGLARAADFGDPMEIGYLPDMFGHVAQMPQLLRLAGFDHAVVWRGVPSAVDRTAFWWTAPDGSTVRAEYLPVGYGNGAAVPDDAPRLLGRVRAHVEELGELLGPDAPLLWMNGADHQAPQPFLGRVVAEANATQDDFCLVVTSLPAYLVAAPTEGLPAWTGELRSGARANLLMGVLSNRVDVKQAAARAERSLERRAEPLSALFVPGPDWPAAALGLAWAEVVRNAAHDSSCACSVDEVVDAVLHRYTEARQVGDGLAARALSALGASLAVCGPVAVNPTSRPRSGIVELVTDGSGPEGAQMLSAHPAAVTDRILAGTELATAVGQARNQAALAGASLVAVDMRFDDDGNFSAVLQTGVTAVPGVDTASALAELYARAGARGQRPVHLRVEHSALSRSLVRVDDVAAFGWRSCVPGPLSVAPVRTVGTALDNELVHVEVDPDDGTFSLVDTSFSLDTGPVAGLDRLVDGGDAGDTYNWSPPGGDAVINRPEAVAVEVVEAGPVRAALRVTRRFVWPERVVGDRRCGTSPVDVVTRLELHAGERLVRVTTALDNTFRDHRLRSWFPLPEAATRSTAECAFGVVERGLDAEGGPHETAIPTFPSRRFVSAGGLTLVHEGLLEYELIEGATLALTLLRCVGMLSGTDLRTRPQPAGPPLAVEGAEMQGRQVLRYGVAVGAVDPYALADQGFLPLEVAVGTGRGSRPAAGSALDLTGAEVSALRRVDGVLEVRVFNPTGEATTVSLSGRRGSLVDLRGRPVETFERSFPLRPWGIATLRLDE